MTVLNPIRNKIVLVLLFFLLFDLSFSFVQYYNSQIGGDIAEVVIPKKDTGYYAVLQDPFGYSAIFQHAEYPNPNRYFAHATTSAYFLHFPKFLQNFMQPIDSVYFAIALSKIGTHILFLVLFCLYIGNKKLNFSKEFLLIAVLTTPFFQTYGFNRYMGIIDQSAVYTFFYAIPIVFFLIAFLPVYRFFVFNESPFTLPLWKKIALLLFIPFISLNGPLIPGIVLIISILFFLYSFQRIRSSGTLKKLSIQQLNVFNLSPFLFVFLITLFLFSLFSLYLGQFNLLNKFDQIPIIERYLRLPIGLYYILTQKLGYFLLILAIGINFLLLHFYLNTVQKKKAFSILKWIGLFSLIYILLLPLGGYRSYRGNIIRYDTILPITLLLIFIFVYSTYHLFQLANFKFKPAFYSYITVLILIFSFSDKLNADANDCERKLMSQLETAKKSKVTLKRDCILMEWNFPLTYQHSELNARLLQHWKITDSLVLYRQ